MCDNMDIGNFDLTFSNFVWFLWLQAEYVVLVIDVFFMFHAVQECQ